MQPYFLPYIGYFQLISVVDTFVVYDNIQYSKKAWINRNRFLQNNIDVLFSLPLKKDSDFLNIDNRFLSNEFSADKILSRIHFAYKKSPNYNILMPLLESIMTYPRDNLFDFVYHSILRICSFLQISTNIIISSTINIEHNLKATQKVIAICKTLNAKVYINSSGGVELYSSDEFSNEGIELLFLKPKDVIYKQFSDEFMPNLSIIDVIAFNDINSIKSMLKNYILFKNSSMGGG
ncbi:hypothetical protein CQA44_03495 [Helicobacter sp. MIT 14-3879]|nr:hypothetical protein CQA44_03495 [Helicobacter sp. MIT 14-3879]